MPYAKGFLRKCLLTGFIVCIPALGWGPGVSAEEHESGSAAAPHDLEEVVVIGSRIEGRSITDSPVPVDLIREEEILKTGQLEVGRAIQRLIPSFNFSSSSISDGTDALRPATLRGMGPDQVLVLVNGKRRHGSALIHVNRSVGRGTAGTDLNAIPIGAIERIEVLRDGASAQYGSDAIAGVINIILKDDDEGGVPRLLWNDLRGRRRSVRRKPRQWIQDRKGRDVARDVRVSRPGADQPGGAEWRHPVPRHHDMQSERL